jgi:hypothetical protein
MSLKYDDIYIKKPLSEYEYSVDEIKELFKCNEDINYFLQYVKIIHPDRGEIVFEPYNFQKDLIIKFQNNRFNVVLSSRQSGKTTVVSVFALHYAIFNENKIVGIVSNKESSAKMILGRIKRTYELIPSWLKPGVVSYNKTSIEFDNGTQIIVSATSPDAFRGNTINLLICDELAFVPKNQSEDFFASNYPTISASKESKIIIISTPNGVFDLFHRLYSAAENNSNTFVPTKVTWREVPGRDEAWAAEQKKNLSEEQFKQEYEVEFLGSASTVINSDTLKFLLTCSKNPIHTDLFGKLLIYEKPIRNGLYVMGVDTAKGTGEDYSAMQILKVISINPIKLQQVATFGDNKIDVYNFAEVVLRTAIYYNNSYVLVENNGEGISIINQLWWEHEYERLVNSGNKTTDLGIRATKTTKPKAVILMKKLIEDGYLSISDVKTIDQLSDFTEKRKNIFCGKNLHDDLVSALYWACYIFNMNILEEDMKFEKKEDEFDGWGILSDINTEIEDWSWLTKTKEKPKSNIEWLIK